MRRRFAGPVPLATARREVMSEQEQHEDEQQEQQEEPSEGGKA
jgi:hypothetical protein